MAGLRHLFLISAFCTISALDLAAQEFNGWVKRNDSLSTAIYQAKVDITSGGKSLVSLKTYFDGSYKFTPGVNQICTVTISYTGFIDTSFIVEADKRGNLSVNNVTVKLRKDGMRLMGVLRSRDENFPIAEAAVICKNIMTREEQVVLTGINGAFNFKLDYETNYRIALDKYSKGLFHKYKDTTFYISTVGFNQPLDYKLDVFLNRLTNPKDVMPEGYDPMKRIKNKTIKPVVQVGAAETDVSPDQSAAVHKPEAVQLKPEQENKKREDSLHLPKKVLPVSTENKSQPDQTEVGVNSRYIADSVSTKPHRATADPQKHKTPDDKTTNAQVPLKRAQEDITTPPVTVPHSTKPAPTDSSSGNAKSIGVSKPIPDRGPAKNASRYRSFESAETQGTAERFNPEWPLIIYAKNSSGLTYSDFNLLHTIVSKLDDNPSARLVIHALAGADEEGPRVLSVARAGHVYEHMLQSNITQERISVRYYGSSASINGCNNLNCPEAELKQNRCLMLEINEPDNASSGVKGADFDPSWPALTYGYNAPDLGSYALAQLRELMMKMNKNPSQTVVLHGLASADETDGVVLAEKRCTQIKAYLGRMGADTSKIKIAAHGNLATRNGCRDIKCPQDIQEQNRCVLIEMK